MKMGILVVNKAKGMTSHDVVAILRKKLNTKRIGHTGTLDPMATGVLPICIGNATRVSDYIMQQGKSYIATLKFGEATTTYDSEGEITNLSENVTFEANTIVNVLSSFKGKIEQSPPIYSAIKVNGKKLYEYAREGKDVEIKKRNVEIYDIKLLELSGKYAKIKVACSKGTYIRSLINDIGLRLNTYAHMTDLIRNRVGKFEIKDSIDISKINEINIDKILDSIIPTEKSLYNLDKINILEDIKFRLINGQRINLNTVKYNGNFNQNEDIVIIINDEFIGIGKVEKNVLKMEKVLCQ
ncbi:MULTISPECIES: tRNA pseudouridine(55) synthase TruB [Helcococcus]|uniref:tRNA pseudouridine synthase B n=1 Tax=Helcococcus bovis TaxID=3153252 RepID=A0ABW9F630_9FIRM